METTSRASALAILVSAALVAPLGIAGDDHDHGDDNKRSNVAASFGRGLNTAQQGNPVGHIVLPNEIRVKVGGVVDFGVSGFHDIVIFKPGFKLQDLIDAGGGQYPLTPPVFVIPPNPADALPANLAFLADKIYYRGINPAGGPLATVPADNPDNDSNRREPVAFLEKGTYLVICNVRPHLLDGMHAYVKVRN